MIIKQNGEEELGRLQHIVAKGHTIKLLWRMRMQAKSVRVTKHHKTKIYQSPHQNIEIIGLTTIIAVEVHLINNMLKKLL